MVAIRNVYSRLITKNINKKDELDKLKEKIGVSFAVGMLTEEEQIELLKMFPQEKAEEEI